MKIIDENIQALLAECTDISVVIRVKETWSDDVDNPIIEIDEESESEIIVGFPKLWEFTLTFNREFTVESHNIKYLKQKAIFDYHKFINDKKIKAYQELDDLIIIDISLLEKRNYLGSLKLRFKESLKNYYYLSEDKYSGYYKLLNNETIIRTISENKLVYNFFEKNLINSFLIAQRKAIKALVKFIDEKLLVLSEQAASIQHIQNDITTSFQNNEEKQNGSNVGKRTFSNKSFELNPELYNADPKNADLLRSEKLKEFHDSLYKNGFIDKIHFQYFFHAFTNHKIVKQIRWERDANELYYLMKSLYDKNIIVQFKNYWQITCKVFIAYHKRLRVVTPTSLARCHSPTKGERLRILNSVISTLK